MNETSIMSNHFINLTTINKLTDSAKSDMVICKGVGAMFTAIKYFLSVRYVYAARN